MTGIEPASRAWKFVVRSADLGKRRADSRVSRANAPNNALTRLLMSHDVPRVLSRLLAQKKRREREAPGMYCTLHYLRLTRAPSLFLTHTNRPLWSPVVIRAHVFPALLVENESKAIEAPFAIVHSSFPAFARLSRT